MSATAVQLREEIDTISQQQSIAVVKNMVRTSISEICYLRNLFNEDCFIPKNYAGVMINALHPMDREEKNIHNEEAWQLTRWLEEGVFDALEKRYLRGLVFAIYDNPKHKDQSKLLETYSYAFTYPDPVNVTLEMTRNNVDKSTLSTDGVKNQAVMLLRTLITLCSTLSPLPRERWITMQLYYYDDITPPDYQPTFFEDSAQALVRPGDSPFVSSPFVMEAGRLRTPFHAMRMKVRVTEGVLQEDGKQAPSEECLEKGEVSLEKEEERVLRAASEMSRIDPTSLSHSLSIKQTDLVSSLDSLQKKRLIEVTRAGYQLTQRGRDWIHNHPLTRLISRQTSQHSSRDTPSKPLVITEGGSEVVDVVAEPERSPSVAVSPSPRTAEASMKALRAREATWGTPMTETGSVRRMKTVTETRKVQLRSKRKQKEESDEEFVLEDEKKAKRSNVKRPIDQG
ncbi:hypothetical protein WA588_002389, partial [Blastocystis sp. NMH]